MLQGRYVTSVLCFWAILVNRTGEATWRFTTLYNHIYSDQRRTCVLSQVNLWSRGCLYALHFISCSFLFGLLASEKMSRGDKIRAIKRLNFGRATAMKSNVCFFFLFFFLQASIRAAATESTTFLTTTTTTRTALNTCCVSAGLHHLLSVVGRESRHAENYCSNH